MSYSSREGTTLSCYASNTLSPTISITGTRSRHPSYHHSMPPRPDVMRDTGSPRVPAIPVTGLTVATAFMFNGVGLRYPVAKMTSTSHGAVINDVSPPAPTAYIT